MSREIKFRVWDDLEKCWFKPTYQAYKGKLKDLHIGLSGDLCMRTIGQFIHLDSMEVDRFQLVQYTGLKDKNGVEIYEGDIVIYSYDEDEFYGEIVADLSTGTSIHAIGTVNFRGTKSQKLSKQHSRWWASGHYGYEVIGNIYENPELL